MTDAVFITGGTGYMGKRLIKLLLDERVKVTALVRPQSIKKLPVGCLPVIANPFDPASYGQFLKIVRLFIYWA